MLPLQDLQPTSDWEGRVRFERAASRQIDLGKGREESLQAEDTNVQAEWFVPAFLALSLLTLPLSSL